MKKTTMKNKEGLYRIAGEKLDINSIVYICKDGKVYRAKRPTFFSKFKTTIIKLWQHLT